MDCLYGRLTDEDDSNSEEENWMDTNWDIVQADSSRRKPEDRTGSEAKSKGGKAEEGSAPLMTRMQLNDHKAGMQGLDKEHINQIIYEVSKGSRFFENERRKEEQVQHRIQEQEQHKRKITDAELKRGKMEADILIAHLNSSRDLTQTIVHVDMDAFYAAVAMRDNPALRDKPMAVGGIGMLSTSNYEARKYGVRAAMPGFIGKKLCPQLVIVPLDFPRYKQVCHQVRHIFADYDPNFCPMSLDEAYLNFTRHLERRQTMSVMERTVLRRCQTPADAGLCRCDLNVTIRKAVLKEENSHMPTDSAADHDPGYRDINANTEKGDSKIHAKENNQLTAAEVDIPVQTTTSSHSGVAGSAHNGQTEDGQAEEPFRKKGQLDCMPAEVGSQCASCGKAIPQYEVVTFGKDLESAVQEMRCRIEQKTCLTASAGIAPNMMLSKVCSDQNKPNGQYFLPANVDDIMSFVEKLPIRKISGIGRVTEQLLGALGISTCSDLFEQRALLYHLYSSISFSYFMRVACGIGSTQVASAREEERKSMSTEQTFGELSRPEELYSKCLELCQSLAEDLAKKQLVGKTVSLKLKTTDFQVRTRAQTITSYTSSAEAIFAVAKGILRAEIQAESPKPLRLRLMGVRMSKLMAESDCPQEKQDTILGFLKKKTAGPRSPTKLHKQTPIPTTSSSAKQTGAAGDSADGSELAAPDVTAAVREEGTEAVSLSESLEPEGDVAWKGAGKPTCSDASEGEDQKAAECRTEQSRTVAVIDTCNAGSQQECRAVAKGSARDSITSESVNEISASKRDTGFTIPEQHECQDLPGTSTLQTSNLKSSVNPAGEPNAQPAADVCLNDRADFSCAASSSVRSAPSESCPSNDDAVTFNRDAVNSSRTQDYSSFFVREPTFTCPVCCKPVSCINLTDFNAHIDKCLQPDYRQSADTTPKPKNSSGSKKSRTSPSARKHPSSQSPAAQRSQTSQKNVYRISNAGKTAASDKQRAKDTHSASSLCMKLSATNSAVFGNGPKDIHAASSSTSASSALSRNSCTGALASRTDAVLCGLSRSETEGSKEMSAISDRRYALQESLAYAELGSTEYMVCPVCGAERADWTLEAFNQHVDACLNRNAISQILREQCIVEEQLRKRPASSQQEDKKNPQHSKKAKKSELPSRPERSILSFFKT